MGWGCCVEKKHRIAFKLYVYLSITLLFIDLFSILFHYSFVFISIYSTFMCVRLRARTCFSL